MRRELVHARVLAAPAAAAAVGAATLAVLGQRADALDQLTGWVAIVCAIVIASTGGTSPIVVLVSAFGASWFLGSLAGLEGVGGAVGAFTVFLHRAVFAHLLLALRPERAALSRRRWIVAALYPVVAAPAIWANPRFSVPLAALLVALCAAVAIRPGRAVGRIRRAAALVGSGVAAIVALGGALELGGIFGWQPAVLHTYEVWFAAGLAVITAQITRSSSVSFAARTIELLDTDHDSLDRALARALGDQTLHVAFSPRESSTPLDPTGTAPGRMLTTYGDPVYASVEHAIGVLDDPPTAAALGTVIRLAHRNAALRIELADRARSIEASAERLGNASRITSDRFAAELQIGPLTRLAAARTALTAAIEFAGASRASSLSDALYALDATRADLVETAQGLRPAALRGRGLVEAIRAVVASCGAEFTAVSITISEAAESALYFVASEAIANSLKHAPGASIRVSIAVVGAEVVLTVADDGPGISGSIDSMLSGPRARVLALGGRVRVDSSPGRGTVVAAAVAGAARRL